MTIRCFLYCATVYFITTRQLYAVNIIAIDVISFKTRGSTSAIRSVNTFDFDSKSIILCAQKCSSNRQCCVASFSKNTSTCSINTSEKCCIDTETKDGWRTIRRNSYHPKTCTGCITFGNSTYSVIGDLTEWEEANENCDCLGGKLLELETSAENEFIKDQVRTLDTGVEGYWIGGYNFNHDHDMEWISKPNQVMPFTDMESTQPNEPVTQPCMMIWRDFNFLWGDHWCNTPLSYICEFELQFP